MNLVARVRGILCALPVSAVVETMRPLPVEPVAGAPPFVAGLSIVRGAPLPVLDLAMLLGLGPGEPGRMVVIRVGERRAAILVDHVEGLRSIDEVREIPPLLSRAAREVVEAVGVLDDQLLAVLRSARLLQEASA